MYWVHVEAGMVFRLRSVFDCLLLSIGLKKSSWAERETLRAVSNPIHMAMNYSSNQLVFVDKSACDWRIYLRGQAWALTGWRVCCKQYFTRGKWWVGLYTLRSLTDTFKLFHSSSHLSWRYAPLRDHWRFFKHGALYKVYRRSLATYESFSCTELRYCHG